MKPILVLPSEEFWQGQDGQPNEPSPVCWKRIELTATMWVSGQFSGIITMGGKFLPDARMNRPGADILADILRRKYFIPTEAILGRADSVMDSFQKAVWLVEHGRQIAPTGTPFVIVSEPLHIRRLETSIRSYTNWAKELNTHSPSDHGFDELPNRPGAYYYVLDHGMLYYTMMDPRGRLTRLWPWVRSLHSRQ